MPNRMVSFMRPLQVRRSLTLSTVDFAERSQQFFAETFALAKSLDGMRGVVGRQFFDLRYLRFFQVARCFNLLSKF